jgi:hypothetical protein
MANYGFLVVSFLVVSAVVVEVVAAAEESVEVVLEVPTVEESEVPKAFLSELQAATDKEIAKATKPNLNEQNSYN